LKSWNIYGKAVDLTYKGEEFYKTRAGACISVMVLAVILAFTLTTLSALIKRERAIIRNQEYKLDQEQMRQPLDLEKFSFGINVKDYQFNDVMDERYFNFEVTKVTREWVTEDGREISKKVNVTKVEMEPCS